jgi:hypothetical protein
MHSVITTLMGAASRAACAFTDSTERDAERRMAVLVSRTGDRLTDEVEREILQQMLGMDRPFSPERPDLVLH